MERAQDAFNQFKRFYYLMKEICLKNNGIEFKAEVKLEDKSQTNILQKIK
jgi:hypothetical protein